MGDVTGRLTLRVNGQVMPTKPGLKVQGIGGVERTPIEGENGIHGYSTKKVPAVVEGAITDMGDLTLTDLANATDVTVTVEGENKKTYTMESAVCAGALELTSGEGEVSIKYIGKYWIEQKF